jgi:hypothetical protein
MKNFFAIVVCFIVLSGCKKAKQVVYTNLITSQTIIGKWEVISYSLKQYANNGQYIKVLQATKPADIFEFLADGTNIQYYLTPASSVTGTYSIKYTAGQYMYSSHRPGIETELDANPGKIEMLGGNSFQITYDVPILTFELPDGTTKKYYFVEVFKRI